MKVLISAFSARIGGGQTYLQNLLSHLPADEDVEVLVFAPLDVQLPRHPRLRRLQTRWPTTNPLLRTLWEKFLLPRVLRREQVKVLFCPGGVVATAAPAGCKTVTMFRNMLPFDATALARMPWGLQRARNFVLKRVMLRSMANADLTIFISDHARGIIERQIHVANAATVAHGLSNAFRTHGKTMQRPSWLPHCDYLLYVSRFDVYKHQAEVVTAYCALPADLRARYRLLLVGEVTEEQRRVITALARSYGAEEGVLVVGPIAYADLPAVYHHATVNLFASSCENCPNIMLEALGAGRAMLASDVLPMPEFGAAAVDYFSPRDPLSIRDAMARVLLDAPHREQLGILAARRSRDFDWARTSQTTWDKILQLTTR